MKQIKKAAVLGAGVMGATIAAHLANAGLDVVMLDIVPRELSEEEKAQGVTESDKRFRNRIVNNALNNLISMKPAAFYLKDFAKNIKVGNFEDDMHLISDCDWIVEVVVENMEIKKKLFVEKVVPNLKRDDVIISTNTSGLSVNTMAEFLPEKIRPNFLVTHFFNPPRYMRLMEIVPSRYTSDEVVNFMSEFISKRLGKGIVYAKDTANFIGNRIGVYVIYSAFKHLMDLDMTVEEADQAAGPAIGMPRTAIFKLADLVGIDTIVHIGKNSYELLKEDDERDIYKIPEFLQKMVDSGLWGNKSKQGFYKKVKNESGRVTLYYDLKDGQFKESVKPKFASVGQTKQLDDVRQKIKVMVNGNDKASQFAWRLLRDGLIYTFKRIPEISDDIVNVDNAMKWGYNWELGPFEIFDAIGVKEFVKKCEQDGVAVPEALKNIESFYKFENSKQYYYDIISGEYKELEQKETTINLNILKRQGKVVESNKGASIIDLGDGVFCLEFHSKMNSISGDILSMTKKAVKRAEEEGVGLVIANQEKAFSVGANLAMLAVAIAEGAFDDINMMVKAFQDAAMAIKYSHVPVVAAPFNMTLGGGCEFCLHADAINAHAETYMGLVEIGVGLLPAGGGTKEMAIRAIQEAEKFNTDVSPFIFKNFMNIAMAKVSMGAYELYELGYMDDNDTVTMDIDRLIYDAKMKVIAMSKNYRPKKPLTELKAPGRSVAASIKSQLWNMKMGGFITEYEEYLGSMIADVITGGDVNAGTLISEEYLLKLERETFVKLCTQKKTIERIQHMLKKNKPLRN
ncbi:MAG: 3-hydroxyacyl-CoA dehydrogenase [Deferribacteres bacterium]|nr:3-hydroxyacyl-CoA dehydrogenase [Deferribacteres bacterium]